MESPDDTGYGTDFCRNPSDCEFCLDVDKIDTINVNDLDAETFERRQVCPATFIFAA